MSYFSFSFLINLQAFLEFSFSSVIMWYWVREKIIETILAAAAKCEKVKGSEYFLNALYLNSELNAFALC